MPIPNFQALMRPVLEFLGDRREASPAEMKQGLATRLGLSAEEFEERLPSGRGRRFANRVQWALVYLAQAHAVERPQRGLYRITDRGRDLLAQNPDRIGVRTLQQFPEFVEFRRRHRTPPGVDVPADAERDPVETIEEAHSELESALAQELLERIMQASPTFFEDLVLDLLVSMGYGGSDPGMRRRLGGTGDEGVDGVIDEDRLGLDQLYVQAKRWSNPVGRREIQGFVGALEGKRAGKGVFITTSTFNANAVEYVRGLSRRVVLIDGTRLAALLIHHGVGVHTARAFEVKEVDEDYFVDVP